MTPNDPPEVPLDTRIVAEQEMFDTIMEGPLMAPMFYANKHLLIPVLDEEGKYNSWQSVLNNQH